MIDIKNLQCIESICEWIHTDNKKTKKIVLVLQAEICNKKSPDNIAYIAQLIETDGRNEKELSSLGGFEDLEYTIKIAKNKYPPMTAKRA